MQTLDSTVKWFNKTEGRDKICKVMQYGSRFLMWHLKTNSGNEQLSNQFKNLFQSTRDARKLFRLAKSLNELQTIIDKLGQNCKTSQEQVARALNILTRIWFLLYWVYDNLSVLSSIKFTTSDPKPLQKKAMTFWFIAIITNLVDTIRQLVVNFQYIQQNKNNQSASQQIINKQNQNKTLYLNLIKIFGDLMPAGQGSEFFPKVFKINLNDGVIGLGGLISGAVAAYQAY
ncbi:unnamed protein product [Paramecium primaurelia]|uniref:Peroxisomal biogenesis factor 11 n=1 Tax=Paramecium primaurelia TaxID=5886 RepID=A0A8S1Q843_PARPR|nr:unnamed protein product [Paramecium primaurelia]